MLRQQIEQNKRKTIVVMFAFFVLVALIGAAVGYANWNNAVSGVVLAAVLALIYMAMMIFNSTKVVMGLNRGREITSKEQYPMLWNVVEELSIVARIPMPKIYIIDDPSPNAFAAGNSPDNASVACTTGLLDKLNREELEGVMAHEVSHIRNYDIRLSTIALALVAVIALLASIGTRMMIWGGGGRRSSSNNKDSGGAIMLVLSIVFMILAPLAATMVQMALSRNREYLADASAVELTRNPQGLISALRKISESEPMESADPSSAALYIENPFKKEKEETKDSFFATHPATSNRIERLEKM
ncbi:zinc metalloprotease HtpX [Carnobacterium maltaromaticum]|uniref:zinc metalloprotease HtpX n=1 Tax=Carnobacterium maltaromaticum TaxID=2751 RepID=UPI000C76E32E|nr:zinc metalloprotease HtpX [Carnobacterium maltaromaticum]PLS32647.1 zinc metalloprotease HtpX [Carnobacterium maltaromaticum]PLS32827.1 zinc metalloprotease HtpX [Carnobacterium maltaromaticum]PLS33412.1 zinc metalloprotease HtpX [Carnobacterium maltaromaticum]PLS40814.1 zinc metalloprotease HtpX [Carnobacterium maltaromaticum]PLS41211.1 zinc metalloprotease HtpX [Carnobacterium maltaromaticum]